MLVAITFLLLFGCGESYCEEGDLFPGMWSGWADIDESQINIATNLHLQLFDVDGSQVEGWLYHTEGVYILQEAYVTPPCSPYWVEGLLEGVRSGGFRIDCLSAMGGNTCVEVQGDGDGITLSYSVPLLGRREIELDSYEEIGERGREEFACLE